MGAVIITVNDFACATMTFVSIWTLTQKNLPALRPGDPCTCATVATLVLRRPFSRWQAPQTLRNTVTSYAWTITGTCVRQPRFYRSLPCCISSTMSVDSLLTSGRPLTPVLCGLSPKQKIRLHVGRIAAIAASEIIAFFDVLTQLLRHQSPLLLQRHLR